ncbi:MAG: AraC family transcriptional regulator [Rhizobiaceae bacterium]|nr:AraC family transcriptional regulator [Rhizobiaceae bacterium]
MDALSDIIRLLRPQTVLLGGLAASGQWGILVPPQQGPTFYIVTAGRCWFRRHDGDMFELNEGDYVLSAKPTADAFLSEPGMRTVLSDESFKASNSVNGEVRIGDPQHQAETRIMGGLIVCDVANAGLLVELLPRYIHLRAAEEAGARLHSLISIIRDEAGASRQGRDSVLARLIEVMLIETLRRESALSLPDRGLLGGLADPQLAKAITDIHADVGRSWTVGELAERSGMSRAVFARRFSEAVGLAPVEYLLQWRMALAKDALHRGSGSLEDIALKIGYKSASAFSTAFRQRVGCPPSEYAAAIHSRG